MANIIHAQIQSLTELDKLYELLKNQRAALVEQLADFVPSLAPTAQLKVHAEWAYLKGQLFMIDELLNYTTIPYDSTIYLSEEERNGL